MTNETKAATDEYEWKKHPANDQQMLRYLNFYCEPTLSRFKGDRLREIREVFARWYADRARIESDRLALAEKETEIGAANEEITAIAIQLCKTLRENERLRGLCGEASAKLKSCSYQLILADGSAKCKVCGVGEDFEHDPLCAIGQFISKLDRASKENI